MNGTILGFSIDEKPNDNYYEIDKETYNFILEHNGQYIVNLGSINDNTNIITKDNICMPQVNLQETIIRQLNKNNKLCNMFIENGIVYTINNIDKHITYKIEDQVNCMEIYKLYKDSILSKEDMIPFKASEDTEYMYININTFLDIYNKLIKNKYYQLFYLRQVNDYVCSLKNINDIYRFQYEMILPQKYQDKLNEQMSMLKMDGD